MAVTVTAAVQEQTACLTWTAERSTPEQAAERAMPGQTAECATPGQQDAWAGGSVAAACLMSRKQRAGSP
eukprot:364229-Chlamydomonas_euryale.AAC.4